MHEVDGALNRTEARRVMGGRVEHAMCAERQETDRRELIVHHRNPRLRELCASDVRRSEAFVAHSRSEAEIERVGAELGLPRGFEAPAGGGGGVGFDGSVGGGGSVAGSLRGSLAGRSAATRSTVATTVATNTGAQGHDPADVAGLAPYEAASARGRPASRADRS